MVSEIITCVTVLFVGIAVLVIIHVCIVGRAFRGDYGASRTGVVLQRGIIASMSSNDIDKLPCFDYKVEDGCVECAVCLESFKEGDKCRLLPICKHTFHAQCIDSWLFKTAACPICRTAAEIISGQSVSNSGEVGV